MTKRVLNLLYVFCTFDYDPYYASTVCECGMPGPVVKAYIINWASSEELQPISIIPACLGPLGVIQAELPSFIGQGKCR